MLLYNTVKSLELICRYTVFLTSPQITYNNFEPLFKRKSSKFKFYNSIRNGIYISKNGVLINALLNVFIGNWSKSS